LNLHVDYHAIGQFLCNSVLPIDVIRVNSKKPPHYHVKLEKTPVYGKIAKTHQYCVNLLHCPLIRVLSRVNMKSHSGTHISDDVAENVTTMVRHLCLGGFVNFWGTHMSAHLSSF
jgi:hypothetical protein